MQGASATNAVLQTMPNTKVKVFVIWEPIIFSDLTLPSDSVLRRVADVRAAQYYDKNHLVSKALQAQMLAHGVTGQDYFVKDQYVWDTMAVYAPGVRWESGSGAKPDFVGAPVVSVSDRLAGYLQGARSLDVPIGNSWCMDFSGTKLEMSKSST